MSAIRVLLAAILASLSIVQPQFCFGDESVGVLKTGQKLDIVLKSLKDAEASCEEQHLAVGWDKGLSGKIFYIDRPDHPDKPLQMVATKAEDAAETEYVVTSLAIYESYSHDSRSGKKNRKREYTEVDEAKIESLKQPKLRVDGVIKKGQKLDAVLQVLQEAGVSCEEQKLQVAWPPGSHGKIFYIQQPGHPEKPLELIATKAATDYVVTSLSIYDSYAADQKSPRNRRQDKHTPVEEVNIKSLKKTKP